MRSGRSLPGEELERRRKLQPTACAEPLLKFAETLVIEEEIKDVLKKLKPRQSGCGTPDAAPLVRLVRSWAEDIQASTSPETVNSLNTRISVSDSCPSTNRSQRRKTSRHRSRNRTLKTNNFVLCWLHHCTYRSEEQVQNDRKFITLNEKT